MENICLSNEFDSFPRPTINPNLLDRIKLIYLLSAVLLTQSLPGKLSAKTHK